MRVTKISVTGLFGQYDHTIPLNQTGWITIIHGPNGVGKTFLLRMIHGVFHANFDVFRKTPFREFRIDFDDGQHLEVTTGRVPLTDAAIRGAHISGLFEDSQGCVFVSGRGPEQRYDSVAYDASDTDPYSANEDIAAHVPNLVQDTQTTWSERATGEVLTLEQVEERYGYRLDRTHLNGPQWLGAITSQIPTLILRTDRLETVTSQANIAAGYPRSVPRKPSLTPLQYCSWRLGEEFEQMRYRAAAWTTALDRTFPARLVARLNPDGEPTPTVSDLRRGLDDMEALRARLARGGLIRTDILQSERDLEFNLPSLDLEHVQTMPDPETMDDMGRKVLSLYLDDTARKLGRFNPLLSRIELLTRIVNQRLAVSSKTLLVGGAGELAIQIRSRTIDPEQLSSGEKHHLILFFTLLFNTSPRTLVLIDEPEVSMHIAWQQEFLRDLAEVAKLVDLDFLIATHSPDIIYDRWDLTVELRGSGPDEEVH
jgi:ABC-type lipoprotein export system ATPase subunit